MSARLFRRLDILLTILILVCTVAVLVNLVRFNSTLLRVGNAIKAIGEPQLVGKEFRAVRRESGTIRKTLVICLKPGCRICEESFVFYRRLISIANNRKDVQIVAATNLPEDRALSYVHVAGLEIKQVLNIISNPIGLRTTPTLLLLNDKNVIVRSWVGRLSAKQESEVKEALFESKGD